jgi:hypothetical protein
MALYDILIGEGEIQELVFESPQGILNSPLDILTDNNSNSGMLVSELELSIETSYLFVM